MPDQQELSEPRLRDGNPWKSSIPDEFIGENKILKNEFFFDEDGGETEYMKRFHKDEGKDTEHFIEYYLRHPIRFDGFERETGQTRLPTDWLAEHCAGAWRYFSKHSGTYVFFEIMEDAFAFRMKWT